MLSRHITDYSKFNISTYIACIVQESCFFQIILVYAANQSNPERTFLTSGKDSCVERLTRGGGGMEDERILEGDGGTGVLPKYDYSSE